MKYNIIKMINMKEQNVPVLLFLLNHWKFHEIIKILLNRQVSKSVLVEYGQQESCLSNAEQFKINKAVSRFSILQVHLFIIRKQLIELKGSTSASIKQYQNTVLIEMIKRRMIHESVSSETRKVLWNQLSQYFSKKHIYQDLKLLEISPDFIATIEKDIRRTHISLEIKMQAKQVLQHFAQYNPYLGYCQGMNNILAFILSQGFICDQAFVIFKKITEQILPSDYYTNLDNIMAYIRIFYEGLSIVHPEIYQHLKKISIEFQNSYAVMLSFVLQWFVCLYCNDNINEQIRLIIWDFLLLEGITVLFKAGFAIFEILKPNILNCNNFESYNMMMKDICKYVQDASLVKKRIQEIYLSPKILFLLKQKLIQPKQCKPDRKLKTSFSKSCNRKHNVCFQVLENNLQQNKPYEFFVFKANEEIKVIPNYLETLHKQYFKQEKQKSKVDALMIGRISHICRNSSDTITEGSISDKNNNEVQDQKSYRSLQSTPKSSKPSTKVSEQSIRDKVSEKISALGAKKSEFQRSESIIFMEQMVKNVSISNLLQFYDVDELFD